MKNYNEESANAEVLFNHFEYILGNHGNSYKISIYGKNEIDFEYAMKTLCLQVFVNMEEEKAARLIVLHKTASKLIC